MSDTQNEVFDIYCKLWRHAEGDGVWVHYEGLPTAASGGYHPREDKPAAGPMIAISRPYYATYDEPSRGRNAGAPTTMPPPDLLEELMTLAHEYGHHLSYKAGNRTKDLVDATIQIERYYAGEDVPPLSEEARNLIRSEERLAWKGGREILKTLGFTDWDSFDAKEINDLEQYEVIFRWEIVPWHVECLFEWTRSNATTFPSARLFKSERDAYYEVLDAAYSTTKARQAEYERGIWDAERAAIVIVREAAKGNASSADIAKAIDACIACYKSETARLKSRKV